MLFNYDHYVKELVTNKKNEVSFADLILQKIQLEKN